MGDHEHGHGPGDETHEGGGRHHTVGARTGVPNRHGLETVCKYTSYIYFCSSDRDPDDTSRLAFHR